MSARVLALLGGIPLLGQERGNIEALRTLADRGVEVLVVTNERWGFLSVQPFLDRLGLPWTSACYGERIGRGLGPLGWLRAVRGMVRANAQLVGHLVRFRPTHLYTCSSAFFVNFLPLLMLIPHPLVFRAGDAPSTHSALHRLLWSGLIGRRVQRFVCISRFIAAELVRAGVDADKVEVIYSAPPRRGPDAVPRAPALPAGAGARRFVYVGQLHEGKGVDVILEAALRVCADVPDARFVLAGYPEEATPAVRARREAVRAAGLDERVTFAGYVDDVPALLARSDVHLAPSTWAEALGNVVLEAKRAARPSIVSRRGGLPELVTDGVDGTVIAPGDVDALVVALRTYIDTPGLAASRGAAAASSLERLGAGRFADDWIRVLERA